MSYVAGGKSIFMPDYMLTPYFAKTVAALFTLGFDAKLSGFHYLLEVILIKGSTHDIVPEAIDGFINVVAERHNTGAQDIRKKLMMLFNDALKESRKTLFGELVYPLTQVSRRNGDGISQLDICILITFLFVDATINQKEVYSGFFNYCSKCGIDILSYVQK